MGLVAGSCEHGNELSGSALAAEQRGGFSRTRFHRVRYGVYAIVVKIM
jgi:hypothetical protein